ncbi:MAG: ribbon-helix-helix protein, CopG family [Candidatus Dormibacteraeota bacterium]|uniref:Ribbon-helix-helix protein, CopG family n=1 Tax=Candidatus Amunia macphersoniae TaxID=3127014 RepID=A0A934KJQ2_9BACT|nr:ribbon-helix-helix protein, CopG family [Candidatus Dormibacteraeota bacterium]
MARRIAVSLDEDVVDALNAHTRGSPLSRSELVNVALRRFLRAERRAARLHVDGAEQARRIASGAIPSHRLEGHLLRLPRGPWEN